MADLSVIVPAYNAESSIAACLRSIATQTVPPKEVIVVDDGSTDDTYEATRQMVGEMGAIKLIILRQVNEGAGAARNRAVLAATENTSPFLTPMIAGCRKSWSYA